MSVDLLNRFFEFNPGLMAEVNKTPALVSLLYDANLLPEQVETEQEAKNLIAIIISYKLGQESL